MLDVDFSYDSMEAFYRAAYSETLVEVSGPVALGATLITARQGAGDYSDAPVPDLVITRGLSREIPATLDLGAGRFRAHLPRNAMVVIAPDTPTNILLDRKNEIEFFAIPYSSLRKLCGDALPADGDFGAVHKASIECPHLNSLFDRTQRRLPVPSGGLAPWQLARVVDHLHAHATEAVSLADLSMITGLSVFHFARAFKASTGIAPHQFQVSLRMESARRALSRSATPITEIALAVGYDSSQSFARAFRSAHGMTPSQYRAATRCTLGRTCS